MPEVIDRRRFIKAAGATAVALATGPLIRPSRAAAAERSAGGGGGAVGHRDAVRLASRAGREAAVGLRVRPAHHARSQDLRVPSGAGHRMEALQRDAHLDVQAPPGREVPRGVRRADRGGRQVHGGAEPQAGCARRLGLLLPQPSGPHRDARQAHRGAVLQDPPVDRALALHPVRRLPERDQQEVLRAGGRAEGLDAPDRHRVLPSRRGQAGRLSPLRGGAQPLAQDARVQGDDHPAHSGSRDAAGRAARRRDRHRPGLRRLPRAGAEGQSEDPRVAERRRSTG